MNELVLSLLHMPTFQGGMEFLPGRTIRVPAPPETIPAHVIRLICHERPEVIAGQVVRQCQVLLAPSHVDSACHVSPVTGTVRQVRSINTFRGPAFEVTIEPSLTSVPAQLSVKPPDERKLDTWLSVMKQIGPWSTPDGGVGLMAQLDAARTNKPDTVICVGLDAFPPYPVRSSILISFPDEAVLGTLIIAELVGASNVMMLAARTGSVLGRLRSSCAKYNVQLRGASDLYPSADPTLVAWSHASKHRKLPRGGNPVSCGLLMMTPWSAVRIGRWFTQGKLDLARPMMIAWPEPDIPMTPSYALVGQPLASLEPRLAQVLTDKRQPVVIGNPMTGRDLVLPLDNDVLTAGTATPVSEQTGKPATTPGVNAQDQTGPAKAMLQYEPVVPEDELLITVLPKINLRAAEPCISCGWCADVCPTRLRPIHLMEMALRGRNDHRLVDQLSWCIDCGLCSHVCPVSLPLAQTLRAAASSPQS